MSLISFQEQDQDYNASYYRPLGTIYRRCPEVLEFRKRNKECIVFKQTAGLICLKAGQVPLLSH